MSKRADTSFYKDKDFLILQQEWYSKLKSAGFSDIEKTFTDGGISLFIKQSCRIDQKRHPHVFESTYSYYSLASEFLHVNTFDSEAEKTVWELYSHGVSYRKIQKTINLSLPRIFTIIKKYKEKMFIHFKLAKEDVSDVNNS